MVPPTFALVSGFTGLIDDDLDTDDDGTFDVVLPWASVADAVGVMEGGVGSANNVYAASLGGVDIFNADYDPDSIVRLADTGEWIAVDIDEVVSEIPGPYAFDDAQSQREDGTPFTPSTALDVQYFDTWKYESCKHSRACQLGTGWTCWLATVRYDPTKSIEDFGEITVVVPQGAGLRQSYDRVFSFQRLGSVLVTARQPLARALRTSASVWQSPPAMRGNRHFCKSAAA